jgi:hypothetical protein
MVPGHGPGTRAKCYALSATKSTQAEERRVDQPAHATVEKSRGKSQLERDAAITRPTQAHAMSAMTTSLAMHHWQIASMTAIWM